MCNNCVKKESIDDLLKDFFCEKHNKGVNVDKNQHYLLTEFAKFLQKDTNTKIEND